jgi:hypothetical protein
MTRNRVTVALIFAAYVATIFAANWLVQNVGVVTVWPPSHLQAPAGVYAVGLALVLRDALQWKAGRWPAIAAILIGAALSYGVAPSLAYASAAAFLFSETADMLVFTPLQQRGWTLALLVSATIGAVVDSVIFLHLAFHSLAFLRGQVVGKLEMVALAVVVSSLVVRPRLARRIA